MITPEPLSDEDLRCIRAHMDHVHKCNCAYCEPYRDTLRLLDEHARYKALEPRMKLLLTICQNSAKDRRMFDVETRAIYANIARLVEGALCPDASTTETKR